MAKRTVWQVKLTGKKSKTTNQVTHFVDHQVLNFYEFSTQTDVAERGNITGVFLPVYTAPKQVVIKVGK